MQEIAFAGVQTLDPLEWLASMVLAPRPQIMTLAALLDVIECFMKHVCVISDRPCMQVQILKPSLEMTSSFLGNAVIPKRILTSHGCSLEVLRKLPLLC